VLYNDKFWRDNFYLVKIGNKTFGSLYINFVLQILKEIYKPLGKWGKLYGEREGIVHTGYSLESVKMNDDQKIFYTKRYKMIDTDWSLFNKIDTHQTALTTILNYLIKKYDVDLDFNVGDDNDRLKKNRISWNIFKDLLIAEKLNIFTPNGENIFYDVLSDLSLSFYMGELSEYQAIKRFKEILGYKNIIKSKMGQFQDTLYGIDFVADGESVQSKSFGYVEKTSSYIRFPYITNKKYDKVNLFSFWNNKNQDWFVFKNENVRKGNKVGFTFPIESLIFPSKEKYLLELKNSNL
jgi:hypothetical protein